MPDTASKPLRVAFLSLGFPPDLGGTEVMNAELAVRLRARGHDVRVLTFPPSEGGDAQAHDAAFPAPITRLPFADGQRRREIDLGAVAATLERWKSEVVYTARSSKITGPLVRALGRAVPVVVGAMELRERHRQRNPFQRWRVRRRYGFDRAARVVVISEDTRRRIADLGVPAERTDLVYPGAALERFRPDPEAASEIRRALGLGERPLLLTVSRLAENKGHGRVIDALPEIARRVPDVVYVIVGGGGAELRAALEARARERGVGERVRFTGRVPETAPYYAACDVFAMPSLYEGAGDSAGEGFGIAYVEAGACGKPVVASSSGGGPEIVVDGVTGRVVDPRDGAALADAIAGLLERRDEARAMGERARERCRRFDWAEGAAALEASLRRAVGAGARRGWW